MKKIVYDGKGIVLGRVGSMAAKECLKGNEVSIINAEKVIISGSKEFIMEKIRHWKNLGGLGQKGPKVPRAADMLMKRMVRGMFPWNRQKGKDAHERLKCYIGNGPFTEAELKNVTKIEPTNPEQFMVLEEVSRLI